MSVAVCPRCGHQFSFGRNAVTQRQLQVGKLICEGMSNKEIGEVMGICERTVKQYVRGLLSHFGVTSRVPLAVKLTQQASQSEKS